MVEILAYVDVIIVDNTNDAEMKFAVDMQQRLSNNDLNW